MKKTETKPENVTETDPASPPRLVEIESILAPLNTALESVRAEANNFATARKTYEDRIAGFNKQKADLAQRIKDLECCELDSSADAVELSFELTSSKSGLELLGRRLAEAQKEEPTDEGLKTTWRNLDAEFYALKGRIIDLHYHQACIDLAKICVMPSEHFGQQQVNYTCGWCGKSGDIRTDVPTGAGIVFEAHTVRRAECLSLRNRQPTEGFVEIAGEGLSDIHGELELITNLSALPPYEKPEAVPAVSVAPVVSKPVSRPKPQLGVDARPPDFKTALHPMSRGMLDQAREAEERNSEQLKAWEKAGILPEGARGSLQVNAFVPKK